MWLITWLFKGPVARFVAILTWRLVRDNFATMDAARLLKSEVSVVVVAPHASLVGEVHTSDHGTLSFLMPLPGREV